MEAKSQSGVYTPTSLYFTALRRGEESCAYITEADKLERIMGHRTISALFILGFVALPLSCDGDDDDTGGTAAKGGSSGHAGSSTAGSSTAGKNTGGKGGTGGTGGTSGKGGTGGTGGTSGKGGTGGSSAGTGGTGNAGTGNTSGTGNAGTGNASGMGNAGAGAGGQAGDTGASGAAGAGGSAPTAEEIRMDKCTTICNFPGDPMGAPVNKCAGDASVCAAGYCDTTGFDATCVTALDAMLDCMINVALPEHFYCGSDDLIKVDYAGAYECAESFNAWVDCANAAGH